MSERHEELAHEFLKKAGNDLITAQRILEMEDGPTDTPAFHAQQAAEKALKAFLMFRAREAPRTHELPELLKLVVGELPGLLRYKTDLKDMSKYGVEIRYPGLLPDPPREDVRRALEVAEAVVLVIKAYLSEASDE